MSDFVDCEKSENPNHCGQGVRSATTNTGTRQMRTSVTTFAGVQSLSPERSGIAYSPSISYMSVSTMRTDTISPGLPSPT